ncbi:tetratricopeptide repeat protein [Nocardia sp. NPDC050175]|uniref:tetratricopeptide repeat protein n=1 Tax=Nocardia sp. NPDC050175 TaxID=3364317 RepID=UPI0037A4204F
MGGRFAVVIGSECDALPTLDFPEQLAGELYSSLCELGGWEPATKRDGPILNPTVAELQAAVDEAFATASEEQATLLLSFVGHGRATGAADFYLLVSDSPERPNSRNAFHLPQEIRERLDNAKLDGLIVLVDACETEQSVVGAASRWPDKVDLAAGRMELLVATGDGPAYSGCFTRSLVNIFFHGLPMSGENLLPSDLRAPIAQRCRRQEPQHLSLAYGGDPGLWLVPNAARRDDAVAGRPAAGLVDQLTRRLVMTDTLRHRLAQVVDAGNQRLRVVVGPAGAGKSTLMAMLIRPRLADNLTDLSAKYITAAIFLDVTSSMESFADEVSTQLRQRVTDFPAAAQLVEHQSDSSGAKQNRFGLTVLEPLARIGKPGLRLHIVIDGLDQPEEGTRKLICAAIAELTRRDDLAHVRLIVGIREGAGVERSAELSHMARIDLQAPTPRDIAEVVSTRRGSAQPNSWIGWIHNVMAELIERSPEGGWLLPRLLVELDLHQAPSSWLYGQTSFDGVVIARVRAATQTAAPPKDPTVAEIIAILVAAGAGPVLPVELLRAALTFRAVILSPKQIRDVTVALGALISRGHAGKPQEMLGIAHNALLRPLESWINQNHTTAGIAHRALAAAIEVGTSTQAVEYARKSAPRHYLANGDSAAAFQFLERMETPRAADNRDQWAAWLPAFVETIGSIHRQTMAVRHKIASWRTESGELNRAASELEQLANEQQTILGADDIDTLRTRYSLAECHGIKGNLSDAILELKQLINDQTRILGPDHPDCMHSRRNLMRFVGIQGNLVQAVTELESLLVDQQEILGIHHRLTLQTRNTLAIYRAQVGDFYQAIAELEQLLVEQIQILGSDHLDALVTRHNLARYRAQSGDFDRAIIEFEQLLIDQKRIIGPDHPRTLRTRNNLAYWRGESGDLALAITELGSLLTDRLRVLGPDHLDTLITRHNLLRCRALAGDTGRVIEEFELLLADQQRLLGPDHPHSLRTRNSIARWSGEVGDFARAVAQYDSLLRDQLRILGPDHPSTRLTRASIAHWREEARGTSQPRTPDRDKLL